MEKQYLENEVTISTRKVLQEAADAERGICNLGRVSLHEMLLIVIIQC